MEWYYSKDGKQLGPVSTQSLQDMISSGEIDSSTLVWKDSMGDWQEVSKISELAQTPTTSTQITSPPASTSDYQKDPGAPSKSAAIGNGSDTSGRPVTTTSIPPAESFDNYLWQAIAVTLLCCMPLGIVALVNASKVDKLKLEGNNEGAYAAAMRAKKWCIITLVAGILFSILWLLFFVLIGNFSALTLEG